MYREIHEQKHTGGSGGGEDEVVLEDKSTLGFKAKSALSMPSVVENSPVLPENAVDSPKIGDHLPFVFNNLMTFPSVMAFVMALSLIHI